MLAGLQAEDAGAWLDQGTEHPHRLALSVRRDRVPHTRRSLAEAFAGRGLQVRPGLRALPGAGCRWGFGFRASPGAGCRCS